PEMAFTTLATGDHQHEPLALPEQVDGPLLQGVGHAEGEWYDSHLGVMSHSPSIAKRVSVSASSIPAASFCIFVHCLSSLDASMRSLRGIVSSSKIFRSLPLAYSMSSRLSSSRSLAFSLAALTCTARLIEPR